MGRHSFGEPPRRLPGHESTLSRGHLLLAARALVAGALVFALAPGAVLAAPAVASEAKPQAHLSSTSTTPNHIRVLLIPNGAKQHALEAAAALSLEQSPRRHLSVAKAAGGADAGAASDELGERTLASLTLQQQRLRPRMIASTASDGTELNSIESPKSAAQTSAQPRSTPSPPSPPPPPPPPPSPTASLPDLKPGDPWAELALTRAKPSWLDVGNQFKISSSRIEEVSLLMPSEFLLRPAFDSPILLKTKLGLVEGVRSIRFNRHLYTFLSLPYALPPVGERRFKAPEPVPAWGASTVYQATKWPPFCVQPSMTLASKSSPVHILSQVMSEDCLYLNIWTPSLKFNKAHKRPVMLWLHGGAFQYGGISVDENDGSALALLGDVVVVTVNYRVSAFGFLNANNPRQAPNNVGLLDQRAAMQWVRDNIRQFGGDPDQVTMFGESAGGHSVGLHMVAPGSQHLFKRAILQSGVPIALLRSYDVNADNVYGKTSGDGVPSMMMARRLGCYQSGTDHLEAGSAPHDAPPELVAGSSPAEANSIASESTASDELASSTLSPSSNSTSSAPSSSSSSSSSAASSSSSAGATSEDREDTTPASGTLTDDSGAAPAGAAEEQPEEVEVVVLNDATLECMRNKSSLDILKAMGAPGNSGFFPSYNDPKGFFPNGNLAEMLDPDKPKLGPQKDYLIGTNTDEGTFMLHYGMPRVFPANTPPLVDSVEALKTALTDEIERVSKQPKLDMNGTQQELAAAAAAGGGGAQAHLYKPLLKTSSSILEGFMSRSRVRVLENGTIIGNTTEWSKEAEFGKNVGQLITDIIFLCPARSLARTLAEQKRNVYFYLYGHRSSRTPYHPWMGVTHHDEVEFVFGRPLRLADVHSGADIEMSQRLIKTWSHFAYTGQMLDQLGLQWPKYDPDENYYMSLIANNASVGERYHDKVCNIYDSVIAVHLQDS